MKITIVTVSFNQAKFLRSAIESVLNQNYSDLEYIVVDPGSTDDSRRIIREYSDRITKVILDPDSGAADGLNKGFSYGTGSIYGFLNSDDMLLPGALRNVAMCFDENLGADIVMGDGFITDRDGQPLRHVKATSFTPVRVVYGGTVSLQQSTFFRSSIYEESNRFNIRNTSSWDIELILDLVRLGATIVYLRSDLSAFRIHEASITGTNRVKAAYAADRRRIFRKVIGRDWRASDHFISAYYKSLRFAADPIQLVHTLRSRLGGSYRSHPSTVSSILHNLSRDAK